ncbi:MAG: hypothetical protein WD649_04370 [Thermoleophilaceae bacterium]
MNPLRAKLLTATCCAGALALAGCGGDSEMDASKPAPVGQPADFPQPEGKTLAQLREELGPGGPVIAPAVSQLEQGSNRLGFGLFDRSRAQIVDAPVALYTAPVGGGPAKGPFIARYESLKTEPNFESRSVASDPDAAKSVYATDVKFPKAGNYELLGIVRLDDRLVAATPAGRALRVLADSKVPEVGERAPRIHTPTTRDVGGAVEKIDTREPPSTMHDEDFADVLGKKPAVLVFSTPRLCQQRVCGPVVDIAEQVKEKLGDKAAFIHMEIYNDNEVEKGLRSQVTDFKLQTEPWLFTVGRDGRIAARIEGPYSARELEQAVGKATKG